MTSCVFDKTKLVRVYNEIANTQMRDMPVFNSALSSFACGFDSNDLHDDYHVGVLLTPWFMNIVAFAKTPEAMSNMCSLKVGEKTELVFPQGNYEFTRAEQDKLGVFLSCSLLSPVFELVDNQTAQEACKLVFANLHTTEQNKFTDNSSQSQQQTLTRRDFLRVFDLSKKSPASQTDTQVSQP